MALIMILPSVSRADTITVATGVVDVDDNDGLCSLKEAIINANDDAATHPDCIAGSGGDTINLAAAIYTLTTVDNTDPTLGPTGLPSITSQITINGNSATIERNSDGGTPEFRIFHVASGGDLTLANITIANGDPGSKRGGGVYNEGTVDISNSTFTGNTATYGGGIYNKGGAAAVDISYSTIYSNTVTTYGGGILNNFSLNIGNSTVSANMADQGGGVLNNGGTLNISNSTFYGNTATSGGGIDNTFGTTIDITNTIVAGNTAANCAGSIASGGYNVESANDCSLSATGDITNSTTITTTLGPLQDNGGPTWTHALLAGSPAIDHVPYATSGCGTTYTTDQRGYVRPCPTEGSCDVGAYEAYALSGDLDCDCDVDVGDIMLVANRWRCRRGDDCYDERYDLDRDGDIDIVDIMLVARNWGAICG